MVGRACVLLLAVAASAIICAEARLLEASAARQLLQTNTRCPAGCNIAGGGCVAEATTGGYRCALCLNRLVVDDNDGTCGCPPGRYALNANDCTDCPKGAWCEGGTYTDVGAPGVVNCTTDLTTVGRRAASIRACVNVKGTFYALDADGVPSATECPADTFGPGLKKQRACLPCPPGYVTNGGVRKTKSSECLVPEGYYLKGPGQVAPCPRGEYKTGFEAASSCTKCAPGVSTAGEASKNVSACNIVLPSYYPASLDGATVNATQKCPQKYYCAGGTATAVFDPSALVASAANTVTVCPDGTWTQGIGATSGDQCMTPPGHKTTVGAGGSGTTVECGDGYYRAEWKRAAAAASCDSCGEGIHSNTTDQISAYAPTPAATPSTVAVRSSKAACFIKAGQGMMYSPASGTFKGVNCVANNYGVASATFGLAAFPCRDCPAGMQTSVSLSNSAQYWATDGEASPSQGFTSPMACVTKPGYGYNGRVASKCPPGSYNAEGNYGTCTKCPVGLSTPNNAADQVVRENCTVAPGYGFKDNVVQPCPVGTYNDALRTNITAECTPCGTGITTSQSGGSSADDCNLCAAGYGGASCGACGGDTGANYGPAGTDNRANCSTCPTMSTGFSFDYAGTNQAFTPASVARDKADSAADCLAEFAQIGDSAWYLGGAASLTNVTDAGVTDFETCVANCKADADCQYVTFDYDTVDVQCTKKVKVVGDKGALVAFKAVVAGDITAASKKNAKTKSLASGSFTFWVEDSTSAAAIGTQTPLAGWTGTNTVQDCLSACDTVTSCAGVVMTDVLSATDNTPATCNLFSGDATVAKFKRSVTKAVVSRLTVADAGWA